MKTLGTVINELCAGKGKRSLKDLIERCGGDRPAVRNSMNHLEKGGFVEVVWVRPFGRKKEVIYRILDRQGLKAKLSQKLKRKNVAWDRLWKAVRVMRTFTLNELSDVTGAGIGNARCFARTYRAAGFLSYTRRGTVHSWRLTKDVGPTRPVYTITKQEEKGNTDEERNA